MTYIAHEEVGQQRPKRDINSIWQLKAEMKGKHAPADL